MELTSGFGLCAGLGARKWQRELRVFSVLVFVLWGLRGGPDSPVSQTTPNLKLETPLGKEGCRNPTACKETSGKSLRP